MGTVAGWIAGKLMRGGGFGFIINVVVGIAGAIVGGWVFGLLGITTGNGITGNLVISLVGAILLLWIISIFKKKKYSEWPEEKLISFRPINNELP